MSFAEENQDNFNGNDGDKKENGDTPTPPPAAETTEPVQKPVIHDPKDPEWEKKKAHYKASIDNAFGALIPGMQISVNRTRPPWCSGWLDTIPVEFDEDGNCNVDLQTIKDTYGGENLQLRFLDQNGQFLYGKTVHFRGIPPKEAGFEIENPAVKQRRELMEIDRRNRQEKETSNSDKLFKMMLDRQETSYKEMLKLLTSTTKQTADPFAGMTAMMAMMEKFDKFRGGNGMQQQQPDEIGSMLTNLMGMFGNMNANKQPAAPQLSGPPVQSRPIMPPMARPAPPAAAAPRPPAAAAPQPPAAAAPQPPAAAAPQPPAAAQRPVPVPEDALDDIDDIDLVDEICGMGDIDIAETVAELMDRLGDERGQRVFQYFVQMTNEGKTEQTEQTEQPETPPDTE